MKVFSSLRSLLFAFVVAGITPLFVFSVLTSVANVERDLASARQNLEFTATAVVLTQERVADSARQLLESIASIPRLIDRGDGECAEYFRALSEVLNVYTNMGVISASGKILCQAAATGVGGYAGDRDYFQAALARGGFVASGYLLGRISKKPLVAFALPVKDAQGRVTAVAFAALNFQELAKAFTDIKLPQGSHLLIMDRAGVVLAENMESSSTIGKLVANPSLQKAIQSGTKGILEGPDANGKQKIYALAQTTLASNSAFFIAVGLDRGAVMEPARTQQLLSLIVLVLVAGLGCVLAWVVGGRAIMKPALLVLEAARNIQAGHLDARVPVAPGEPNNELTQIADGFNQMADTLQQREADLMLELSRSEQAFQALDLVVNSLQDGLIAVDANGHILLANELASNDFGLGDGFTPTSVPWSQRFGLFVPGTDVLYATEDLPLYKALHGQSGGSQQVWVKNDNVPEGKLLSVRYRPMTDDQGQTGALLVMTDITELDKLQQEQTKSDLVLRESQRQLLDAQRLGRIGHWQMDPVTHIISWSEELYELFGVLPGTFDGRHQTFLQWGLGSRGRSKRIASE